MDFIKQRALMIVVISAVVILPAGVHAADAFPARPIRLIVPYPPGGGTDVVARVLGEKLGASLGQPIVVDNRGGAGGVLGTEIVAKAAPDGYTLLLVPTSHVINPSIYAKLPYDTVADFAPITMVASAVILMAVNPRVPADTVRGFVDATKANPKAIGNYGSAGVGTVFHLTGQLFNQLSGLSLQHVPYRGGGPTVTALLAGEVPLAFETILSLQPHVRVGTLSSAGDHQRAAQRHDARDSDHRGGGLSRSDRRQFVCAVRPRQNASVDPDAAPRRRGGSARFAGSARSAARARCRGCRRQLH